MTPAPGAKHLLHLPLQLRCRCSSLGRRGRNKPGNSIYIDIVDINNKINNPDIVNNYIDNYIDPNISNIYIGNNDIDIVTNNNDNSSINVNDSIDTNVSDNSGNTVISGYTATQ